MSVRSSILSFTNTFFPEKDKSGNTFYPLWFNGRNSNPDWINVDDVSSVYECIPHLKIVINRKASMFSNMRFITVDPITGEEFESNESKDVLKLLRQPNPAQSQQHWLMQFKIYEQLYGAAFSHMVKGRPDMVPRAIWNLPSQLMEVEMTGQIYKMTEIDEIVKEYKLQQSNGGTLSFLNDEIIHSVVPSIENPIQGDNKIKSLQKPLSNIAGALQFRNVIITQKGALGILSGDSKDQAGPMPLGQSARKKIEEQHREMYGIEDSKSKLLMTETPVKWTPMTFPTKDLMLFEEITQDMDMIIDAYGLNNHQFSKLKGSSFENLKEGDKIAYQNTILPEAEDFTQNLSNSLNTEEKGFVIKPSFDHLPMLQKNLSEKADGIVKIVDASIRLREAGFTEEAERLLEHINAKK